MNRISFLIKPASSSCNMQCRYCFYNDVSQHRKIDNYGKMNKNVMKSLIDKAINIPNVNEITFMFQGGEPTLAGIDFFKDFCNYVDQKKKNNQLIHYGIQSNGILMNEEWYQLFQKYNFLVGISLDGYKDNHDYYRLTKKSGTSYKQVMSIITSLKKHNIDFNILTVLTKGLAKHPDKLYKFIKNNDLKYIQFIPCLQDLDEIENKFALTPELFSHFYKRIYTLWKEDFLQGHYYSIALFDNIICMLKGIAPKICGMLGKCSPHMVVESDGSIYPCDFYVLDEYCVGNITKDSIENVFNHENMKHFLNQKRQLNSLCEKCEFIEICHGNCKRMSQTYYNNDYCGYKDFLAFSIPSMQYIAQYIID